VMEPKFVRVADGLTAQVLDRRILPRNLDLLLGEMVALRSRPIHLLGARRACMDDDHAAEPWATGVWRGLELRLSICNFCGSIEVRDVSLDILPGVTVGAGGPRRRSAVMGWYAGKRAAGRTYR
jgi:hypothetical protein